MMRKHFVLGGCILAAACQQIAAPSNFAANDSISDVPNYSAETVPDKHPLDSKALDHARSELRKNPAVMDFLLDPAQAVILQVAVKDDGSRRYGLAETFCMDLKDWGLGDWRSVVRIVDGDKLAISGGDFRSISLGTVQCRDQQRLD